MSTSTTKRGVDAHLRSPPALTEDLALTAEPRRAATGHRGASVAGAGHFFRHFGEMFVAMMVGMMVLGGLDGGILSAFGTSVRHLRDVSPETFALVMALNMTIGMTLWMRHRGHSWAMCAEMGAAMFAPAILAIVLFRAGVIAGQAAGGVLMGTMVPAMFAVMLIRRTEYSQPVRSNARERPARAEAGRRVRTRRKSHLLREPR
jgi:hypothetical protein